MVFEVITDENFLEDSHAYYFLEKYLAIVHTRNQKKCDKSTDLPKLVVGSTSCIFIILSKKHFI